MRILFLTDNFPPETNAPASRTHEHCRHWVAAGHEVCVVTTAPNFPGGKVFAGYRNALWRRETIDGIHVLRVWTYITANEGFLRRTLDYMSFMGSAILASPFLTRPDVIVATSPQFFAPCAAYVISLLRRRPFVFELRDLWPDSIVAVGAMRETIAIRALRRLEYVLYRRAARIVSVTRSFTKVLSGNGIPSEKIDFVPNGVEWTAYQPGAKPAALVQQLGIGGKFVASYVGTLGMAHGLGALLDAADILRERDDITFLLIGTGAQHAALAEQTGTRGLRNVHFVGAVSKSEVKEYWRLSDVALVLLRDTPLFEHVIPSKMFEAMSMERPIILGVRGESLEILEASGAGVPIPPEDGRALAQAITWFADNPDQATSMGRAGRKFVIERHDRGVLAARMLTILEDVSRNERPSLPNVVH